jgi:uncharacterized damage-inducible protein DinB
MAAPLADLAHRFRFNESLLRMITEALSDEDWARLPSEVGGNSAHWIVGHVATSRRFLMRKLGLDVAEQPWEEQFGMGAEHGDPAGYPRVDELLADVFEAGEPLANRLSEMSEDDAAAPFDIKFPDGADTLGGASSFLLFHEIYHLGQIGLLRRISGHAGFA